MVYIYRSKQSDCLTCPPAAQCAAKLLKCLCKCDYENVALTGRYRVCADQDGFARISERVQSLV